MNEWILWMNVGKELECQQLTFLDVGILIILNH